MSIQKIFRFLLLLGVAQTIILFTSCESVIKKDKSSEVPELLTRGDLIQNGKEWDFVQNSYAQQLKNIQLGNKVNEAKLNLAEIFIKEARITGEHGHYYPAALRMTRDILKTESTPEIRFRTLVTKAGVELSLHEFKQALQTGQQAIQLNDHNAQIYGVLVDCYVELGDYSKAIAMADRMISIKPDLRSYARIAYLREIHGDYEGAIDALTLAVKAGYPGYEETAWAMQTLGEVFEQYGELDKAEKVYKTILEERENYPFAVASLGHLALKSGRLTEAEIKTKQAIDIIPEVGFYIQLAELYKAQNKTSELRAVLDEILLMLEDDVIHGHNMNLEYAQLYLNLYEDPESALTYAMLEYNKRPKNIDVNRLLAKIYVAQNEIQKAHQHLSAASITDSNHPQLELLKVSVDFKEALSMN